MKINVEKTDSKGKFGEANPIDLVLESTKMRIAMSYEDAYRLCVDVLAHLYQERQIENYRITTKGGSALNTAVTKDW